MTDYLKRQASTTAAFVEAASPLLTPFGRPPIMVGCLAEHRDGRIFGVSLRDAGMPPQSTTRTTSGHVVGGPLIGPAYREAISPVTDAAWSFTIPSHVFVNAGGSERPAFADVASPADLLGDKLYKIDSRGPQPARLTRVNASLTLSGGGLPDARLTGALEIVPQDASRFASVGDGAAPLLTVDHRLVGFLLSRDGDRYFVIPAADWLTAHGLQLLTEKTARRHNLDASAALFDLHSIEGRLDDLTRQWRQYPDDVDVVAVTEQAAAFAAASTPKSELFAALEDLE